MLLSVLTESEMEYWKLVGKVEPATPGKIKGETIFVDGIRYRYNTEGFFYERVKEGQ